MSKRMLLIAERFYNYNDAIRNFFINNGYAVEVYDNGTFSYTIKEKIFNKLYSIKDEIIGVKTERQVPEREVNRKDQEIWEMYLQFKPDVVIVLKGNLLSSKLLEQMNSTIKILWMMDSLSRYPLLVKRARYYDKVYVFERSDIELLNKHCIDAEYLPLCADETIYYPMQNTKDIDVLFVGAIYENRKKMLERLQKQFPNLNIQLYGYSLRRNEVIKRILYKAGLIDRSYHPPVKPNKVNELYSRSKICLNIHHTQTIYGANMRVFEILATKNFELVDRNKYIEENFDEGVVMYDSEKDLYEKIKYYLEHEKERELIAQKGYKIVMSDHLFTNRLKIIINTIEKKYESIAKNN